MQGPEHSPNRPSLALVTPSYRPDRERCELLVESIQRFNTDLHHYLLVDRRDLRHFRRLETDRVTLICKEELLPRDLHQIPLVPSMWASHKRRPVRGWIIQQVVKLAVASVLDADVLVYIDSDNVFIRPFDTETFLLHGQPGLLDVDYESPDVRRWTQESCALLGHERPCPVRGHVGQVICWRRENVLTMLDLVERTTQRDWPSAILPLSTFSEYILYGVYVREVLGYERSGHCPSTVPLVKASWDLDLSSGAAMEEFFSEFEPETVAVMIHSKDGIPVDSYRRHVYQSWSEGGH